MLPFEPIPPSPAVPPVDATGRMFRGALVGGVLGAVLSVSMLLGVQALERRAAQALVDESEIDAVELREPVRFHHGFRRAELPPCPALSRCPFLRAHPEALYAR